MSGDIDLYHRTGIPGDSGDIPLAGRGLIACARKWTGGDHISEKKRWLHSRLSSLLYHLLEGGDAVEDPLSLSSKMKAKGERINPVHIERAVFLSSERFVGGPGSTSSPSSLSHQKEEEGEEEGMLDACLQLLFFDTLLSLLRMVPNCLFFLSAAEPVFNRALLLAESETAHRHFLLQIGETNAFHAFTDSLLQVEGNGGGGDLNTNAHHSSSSGSGHGSSSAFFLSMNDWSSSGV